MKSLSNINFVYHVVLLIDRRTHIPSLVMMLKLGKKISVENQSVLSIYGYNMLAFKPWHTNYIAWNTCPCHYIILLCAEYAGYQTNKLYSSLHVSFLDRSRRLEH